jgi:hypothetical protein
MHVRSTTFFTVICAIIGSLRSEYLRTIRYSTTAFRIANNPIAPSSRALSQASETDHRLESNALKPARNAVTITSSQESTGSLSLRMTSL